MPRVALAAAALVLTAAPLHGQSPTPCHGDALDLARLVARQDSFVILVQGTPRGWQRSALERVADGFVYREDVEMGGGMRQHTEVRLGPDGAVRSVTQRGAARGMQLRIDVAYADGRVRGSAVAPSPAGVREIAIDTALAGCPVDDNALQPLLGAVRWAERGSWPITVFKAGEGSATAAEARAVGAETITVPAGDVPVHRVDLVIDGRTVAMYVSREAPYRVVKIAPEGAPMEIVLAR